MTQSTSSVLVSKAIDNGYIHQTIRDTCNTSAIFIVVWVGILLCSYKVAFVDLSVVARSSCHIDTCSGSPMVLKV